MNSERTFTTNTRRTVVTLVIAALMALSIIVAQHNLSTLTGIGSAPVAHACQSHAGGC